MFSTLRIRITAAQVCQGSLGYAQSFHLDDFQYTHAPLT